jgi:hypothetical protein
MHSMKSLRCASRPSRIAITLCTVAVAAVGAASLPGCLGPGDGCGVGAVPTMGDAGTAASVSADGVVTFQTIPAGTSEDFQVTVRDSANTDETILSATLVGAGADAFKVVAKFPVYVPAGHGVPIDVQFVPPSASTFYAQLVLQTANMGPSPVSLVGSAH